MPNGNGNEPKLKKVMEISIDPEDNDRVYLAAPMTNEAGRKLCFDVLAEAIKIVANQKDSPIVQPSDLRIVEP